MLIRKNLLLQIRQDNHGNHGNQWKNLNFNIISYIILLVLIHIYCLYCPYIFASNIVNNKCNNLTKINPLIKKSDINIINKYLCFYTSIKENKMRLFAIHQGNIAHSIKIDIKYKNLKPTNNVSNNLPIIRTLTKNQHLLLAEFTIIDPYKSSHFQYKPLVYKGSIKNIENIRKSIYVYHLPYSKGQSYLISQGYNSSSTHKGNYKYSIDFAMQLGSKIIATRSGIVIETEDKYTKGGFSQDLLQKANLIRILHEDATVATYSHLKPQGVIVKIGQKIFQGQHIGYSGNTGYSQGPHLHFHISTLIKTSNNNIKEMTIPISFKTCKNNKLMYGITLKEGEIYTAC